MIDYNLRQKTVTASIWHLIEKLGLVGSAFVINIILARLLTPHDYGLIGNITIFTIIANTFIEGGLATALIQKQKSDENDYITIFIFNLVISVSLYLLLFFFAPLIASYFEEPSLRLLLRVVGLLLIFNSLGIIQATLLTKSLNFKPLTKSALSASLLSGILAIFLAYQGFGVWSLAWQLITNVLIRTLFLWRYSDWKLKGRFSISSLSGLFNYGSKILISSLIENIYQSAFSWIITKRFSIQSLGFYTQAKKLQEIPVMIVSNVIGGVTFPALSTIQDNNQKLKSSYKIILQLQVFINFPLMLFLIIVAKPLVTVLLTPKWLPSVPFIQLLALAGMVYTLQTTNLNILKVKGRPDIFLNLEIIKKVVGIILILLGLHWGIIGLVSGLVVSSYISFFLNSHYSGRLINYPVIEQLTDIAPYFLVSILMAFLAYLVKFLFQLNDWGLLLIQSGVAIVSYVLLTLLFRLEAFKELRAISSLLKNK